MQYKTGVARDLRKIGQELGVAHLLEGSVQRVANKRASQRAADQCTQRRARWAETYDRPLGDVFAIQSEIAKAIADQLQAKLSPSEKNAIEQRPTTDVAAFELYSRAKDLILNTGFSAIAAQNLARRNRFAEPGACARSFLLRCAVPARLRARSALRPGSRSHSGPAGAGGDAVEAAFSYGLTPAKRISPAPIIFTLAIVITTARWRSSRLSAGQCPIRLGDLRIDRLHRAAARCVGGGIA